MPDVLPHAPLPPAEAIAWFKTKGYTVSFAWQDLWRQQHSESFTVAKLARLDLLQATHAAVLEALRDGTTFEWFRARLEARLKRAGWWGVKEMTDPLTGEVKKVQLGSRRRLETIYRTNLGTAYAAGQWQRIERTAAALPYLGYYAVGDTRTRHEHAAYSGTVLPADSPTWSWLAPPLDFLCRCWLEQMSQRRLDRAGGKVSAEPDPLPYLYTNPRTGITEYVPKGVAPGWNYNPGQARGLMAQALAAQTAGQLDRTAAAVAAAAGMPPPPRHLTPSEIAALEREAAAYVLRRGQLTGREHAVAVDRRTGHVDLLEGTVGQVDLPAPLLVRLREGGQQIALHHNHPSNAPLSPADVHLLRLPGLAQIAAHGHGGTVSQAARGPAWPVDDRRRREAMMEALTQLRHYLSSVPAADRQVVLPIAAIRTLVEAGLIAGTVTAGPAAAEILARHQDAMETAVSSAGRVVGELLRRETMARVREDDDQDLPPMIIDPPWGGDRAAWVAYRDRLRALPPSAVRDFEIAEAEIEIVDAETV